MGLFDIFKKKEKAKPDFLNLNVKQLEQGFMFDYDMETWTVDDVYIYDWGNEYFSVEYKINNARDSYFMSVDEDDALEIAITQKVKIRSIDENLPEYIKTNNQPPGKIVYKGITLLLDGEKPGYFKPLQSPDSAWEEFISWDYYDAQNTHTLSIEQWDENSFEATFGKLVSEYSITNILPNPNFKFSDEE